jgi:hypothetical protein
MLAAAVQAQQLPPFSQSAPSTTPAQAQRTPPAAPAPTTSSATPAPSTPPVNCRAEAQSKGLRGQDMRDAVLICVQERRLACAKEAVGRKIVGPARRDFMQTCAGRPDRGNTKD